MLDLGYVFKHKVDHTLLKGPLVEVELTNGGLDDWHAPCLKQNALPTTKRVEAPLAPGLEFPLVVEEHHKQPLSAALIP